MNVETKILNQVLLSCKGFERDTSTTQVGNVTALDNLLSVGQVEKQ